MKNPLNNKYILIGLVLLIGISIGWFIKTSNQQTDESQSHQHTESSAEDATTESEDQTWTCSMHPQIKRDEPGDCPICGMDLIPMEATESELDPMAVSMSPTAMQLAQVQTAIVGEGDVGKTIRLNGKVQADERLRFTQSSHIPGRVERLMVNFTGEFISEGQVIAYVYSPDLVTAQDELFEARKIMETQPALFNAAKEKLKNWKLSDKQIEQILASNTPIDQFPVLANVSGYVTEKMVNPGDYIQQGQALYEIADLSRVWIMFDVYESDMNWIKKGATLSYTVRSIPGKTFKGTISYIDPVIDSKTRVASARVEAANKGLALKPEMFVSGTIDAKVNSINATMTVPKSAVMWTGKRSLVYVMDESDQGISFLMREVVLGPDLGEKYVIESGLEIGEEIAVNGTFSIDAAAQLAGKPSMMNPKGDVVSTGHQHGDTADQPSKKSSDMSKDHSVSEKAKAALQPLFSNYFNLKTALADDDFEKANAAGKAMSTALSGVDMSVFKGGAHDNWMRLSSSLKESLQHVGHVDDIETLRKSFIDISNNMIIIAETFGPISSTIYIQHCPMADDNKGADWLSQVKEIRNPYFGASMLKCGETTKTLE